MSQATLASVAPGISEALVATAMGLFAAIPAVIGYNRFSARVEVLMNRYETFSEELISHSVPRCSCSKMKPENNAGNRASTGNLVSSKWPANVNPCPTSTSCRIST